MNSKLFILLKSFEQGYACVWALDNQGQNTFNSKRFRSKSFFISLQNAYDRFEKMQMFEKCNSLKNANAEFYYLVSTATTIFWTWNTANVSIELHVKCLFISEKQNIYVNVQYIKGVPNKNEILSSMYILWSYFNHFGDFRFVVLGYIHLIFQLYLKQEL